MRPYFVKRVSFLQCVSVFFLGFSFAAGAVYVSFACLLLAVVFDFLGGFLQREKNKDIK